MDIRSAIKLNNGVKMPVLGLGTWKMNPKEAEQSVSWALEAGYRHIDTAHFYKNEEGVGNGVRSSGVPRGDVFVTTKLWDSGMRNPRKAFEESAKKLGLGAVDLYLMHFPFTNVQGRKSAWKEMESLHKEGKARSIGVSNFTIRHLSELLSYANVVPAVNQVEFSPFLFQKELLQFCEKNKIQLVAYSPLTHSKRLRDPRLVELASHYNKTPAQLALRWALQHHLVVIPKSSRKERITENADVFDFSISPQHMKSMDSWNENYRTCWDPTNAP